jgi:hypothetical protein
VGIMISFKVQVAAMVFMPYMYKGEVAYGGSSMVSTAPIEGHYPQNSPAACNGDGGELCWNTARTHSSWMMSGRDFEATGSSERTNAT